MPRANRTCYDSSPPYWILKVCETFPFKAMPFLCIHESLENGQQIFYCWHVLISKLTCLRMRHTFLVMTKLVPVVAKYDQSLLEKVGQLLKHTYCHRAGDGQRQPYVSTTSY